MKNLRALDAWRQGTGIEKLFVMGWAGSLTLVLFAFVALFFAFGFWWPYWRAGDMDMWMVYEAFIANDGLRQEYFDHPGYLTILFLSCWFKLLHAGGLLPIHALHELPPVSDIAASAAAWMRATQAARLLSLGIAVGFILTFAFLLRRLIDNWRVTVLATFALAFSGGMMMEARIVRTELIAAGFAYTAFLILLLEARRPTRLAPLAMGLASLLATLAMLNKVQFIFLLMTFPPIIFFFGRLNPLPVRREAGWIPIATIAAGIVAAGMLAVLAAPIAMAGLFHPDAVAQRARIFGTGFPVYQSFVAVWLFAWIAAYAARFRIGVADTVTAMACVVAGVSLGILAITFRLDSQNVLVVMNPIEQMLTIAAAGYPELAQGGGSFLRSLLSGAVLVLARQTFVLSSSARPTVFLEWVVFAAAVFAWRKGERKVVFQIALLIVSAWAVDLVGSLRWLKIEYFIITDPLMIFAAAWLLVSVPELQSHRWAFPTGLAIIVVTVAVGLAEPVKHTFKTDMPLDFCVPNYPYTKRIERFSYCPT